MLKVEEEWRYKRRKEGVGLEVCARSVECSSLCRIRRLEGVVVGVKK